MHRVILSSRDERELSYHIAGFNGNVSIVSLFSTMLAVDLDKYSSSCQRNIPCTTVVLNFNYFC